MLVPLNCPSAVALRPMLCVLGTNNLLRRHYRDRTVASTKRRSCNRTKRSGARVNAVCRHVTVTLIGDIQKFARRVHGEAEGTETRAGVAHESKAARTGVYAKGCDVRVAIVDHVSELAGPV